MRTAAAQSTTQLHFPRLVSFEENPRKSAQFADKSMPLQKQMQFFRQLSANAFRGCDLLNSRPPKTIHGPEPLQQQTFAILTHARTIIEDAFLDSLFHQQL